MPQVMNSSSDSALKREVQISVGTPGPQLRAPDLSGHCQTSTASARSQWALQDLNRERQMSVGTAGTQPRAPDLSGHCRTSLGSASSGCQIECHKEGQKECRNIRLIRQIECQIECQSIIEHISDKMPNRMRDRMPDGMSEYTVYARKNAR